MKRYDSDAIKKELSGINGWKFIEGAIEKDFIFKDFKEALLAMVRIGFEAEAMNHHPDWINSYNRLKIRLRSHDADGITDRDFSLARKINDLLDKHK
jgi:4a-hydroxytetrahydrobiopterin dehydratase